jgi:hypothetical protein
MFQNALCQGQPTEWWYPVRDGKTSAELSEISRNMKRAMKICRECPAIVQCAQHSLENNEVGIWGGMGEKTRKRARRMVRFGAPIETVIKELVEGYKV